MGTPQLANLYMTHGSAICRLLRAGRVPRPRRADAARQAASALEASSKIRAWCLGSDHPLCFATAAAHAAAVEQAKQTEAGSPLRREDHGLSRH